MASPNPSLAGSLLPLVAWFGGLVAYAAVTVESLFAAQDPVFIVARLTAYVTAGTVATLSIAFVALFGLTCGWMLNWLGDAPDPRAIAAALCRSFWSMAAYIWVGAAFMLVEPPMALTPLEIVQPRLLEARIAETWGFVWLARLHYLALGCFLGLAVWFLARRARIGNAIIAVAFGAVAMMALAKGFGLLAGAPRT